MVDYTDLCDFDGVCHWTLKNVQNMTESAAAKIDCYMCLPDPTSNSYQIKPMGESKVLPLNKVKKTLNTCINHHVTRFHTSEYKKTL